MKAAVFKGKGRIDVEQVEIPVLQPEQVLVKVAFCGVCGTDVHIFEGAEGAAQTVPPAILGHEFSGIVEAVGTQVKALTVGDKVAVDPNCLCGACHYCRSGIGHFCEHTIAYGTIQDGGFAQYCAVHEKAAYRLPEGLSLEHGAMAEPIACCLHGIDECRILPGSTAYIIGAGPIGLLMLQLAKLAGAVRVTVAEPVAEKREKARLLGADLVLDPIHEDAAQALRQHGMERLETVIDCVGLPSTMEQAVSLAGKKSTVMLFGLGTPSDTITIHPFELFKREITLKSSFINPYTLGRAIEILASGRLQLGPIFSHVVPLEELSHVLEDPKTRSKGKVLVNPWQ